MKGIPSVAAGYGYGSEQELSDAQPTYNVKTVTQLLDFFLNDV